LAEEVVEIVAPLLVGRAPDEPLFPTVAGSMRLLSNWKRATDWKRYGRGRTVKDLRHTAATLWLSNGLDLKTVQTWLGHSTARLTTDTYAHWMGSDSDAAALEKLNAALRGDARGARSRNLRSEK
jgi:integrase